ncbi:MAG: TonB-dependent receptor [Parasphingorhabdus sp.]|nr:TonB-dependent receptor [Parasphingorhabdus sp.]
MEFHFNRKRLLFSTVSALTIGLAPSSAFAQDAGNQEETKASAFQEIIVTARRRDERLQDVPLAVSVMTEEELKTQLVNDQNDLQQKVPSLSVAGRFGHTGGTYGMRGLSGTSTGTPSVGTYFSEVPTPTNNIGVDTSAGSSLYDLASVQVLKGPQGTLFGRTSVAGAVLVTPAAPNLSEVEAVGNLSLGSMGLVQGTLAVSIPVIDDVLAIRVAGNYNHRRGYTKVIGTGERLDGLDNDSQRVSVRFEPFSWLKNTTIYDRFHADQSSAAYVPVAYNPNHALFNLPAAAGPAVFGTACTAAESFGLTPSVAACIQQRLDILTSIRGNLEAETARTAAGGDALRNVNAGNTTGFIDRHTHETVVNRTELTLPALGPLELQLKNIFGYQTTKGLTGVNIGGIPDDLIILYVGVGAGAALNQSGNQPVLSLGKGNKFYSNETQLSGTLYDDRLNFVVGYYYQHAPSRPDLVNLGSIQKAFGGITTLNLGYGATNPFTVGGRANQDAFYGQATLSLDGLLDGVKLTGGVRHTKDDFLLRTAAAVTNPVTGVMTPSSTVTTQAFKSSGTNYNFSIDYKATPELLVYVAHRKGYSPGGLNNLNAANSPLFKEQYAPETIEDIEGGFKWDFNFGATRGRLNMAAYQAWYSGIQRPISTLSSSGSAVSFIANVAKAKLRGLEVELTVLPTDNLTLGFNYSLNDTKYTSWTGADPYGGTTGLDADGNLDLSDSPFQNAPKHKLNVNATYDIPLAGDNGTVAITGQYTYQSRAYYLSAANRYLELFPDTTRDNISQKGFGIANARIDWREPLGHEGITASLFARNLFDKLYATTSSSLNNSLGVTAKQFAEPRIFGASLSFQY